MNCGAVGKVTAADARKAAARHAASLVNNVDPANERAKARTVASHTFGATIDDYLAAKEGVVKLRSLVEIKRHLTKRFHRLHGLALGSISRADVASEVDAIASKHGSTAANRARASLSAFFVWAIGAGRTDHNPVVDTNKQEENPERQRILIEIEEEGNDDQPRAINWSELVTLWNALPGNEYGAIVKLLALTGCRRDEIGSLRWEEIDLEKRVISIPGNRTKNAKAHKLPLSPLALSILQSVPRRERDCVFGIGQGGYAGWGKSKAKLDEAVKLKDHWTLHDIRRTVRTGLGALGIEPHISEAVINHLPAKLVRTYDVNSYLKEKRAALDLWASELDVALRKARGENITSLPKRKA
jgi:integrase